MKHLLVFLGVLASVTTAFAQNVFVVLEDKEPRVVKEIRLHQPIIEKDGKLAVASGDSYALGRSSVYRPGLVTLTDFRVGTSRLESTGGGSSNHRLNIYGRAKSDTAFKKCFMLLEMTAWKSKGVVFVEMPDLPVGEAVELNLSFALQERLEEGSYRVHLFSDGIELLHTKMPEAYVAKQKQKTAELLAGKTKDFPPILAQRVNPVYPEALRKSKTAGTARVRLVVTKNGDVESPELVTASDPAFGEAAVAAVAKWKFDPALKGGKFANARLEVPIEFRPPK